MSNSTTDYTTEKFLINNEPVMKLAVDVLQILTKTNKIIMKGKGESCPATVSVANIITQNIQNPNVTITQKISVGSEISDDGRMVSTIEIMITKTNQYTLPGPLSNIFSHSLHTLSSISDSRL